MSELHVIGDKMHTILKNNKWLYIDSEYSFKLVDESLHNHVTAIIKPAHIDIVSQDSKSTLSTAQLKDRIISDWFLIDNENVRIKNNTKRRNKNKLK